MRLEAKERQARADNYGTGDMRVCGASGRVWLHVACCVCVGGGDKVGIV